MKKKIVLPFSITLGILVLVFPFIDFGKAASPPQKECPSCDSFGVLRFPERKEAPGFSLNSLDGKKISLSEFRGKPVLITFWATWCESCKEELPVLNKFCVGKGDQLVFL